MQRLPCGGRLRGWGLIREDSITVRGCDIQHALQVDVQSSFYGRGVHSMGVSRGFQKCLEDHTLNGRRVGWGGAHMGKENGRRAYVFR